MASTQSNMNSADVAAGNDGTATQFNNVRKDIKLGIRDKQINDDGTTVTFDLSLTNVHEITLGGNRTLALSNIKRGQHFRIEIIQPAVSPGKTVTWFSGISWINATIPTLSTGASRKDSFVFYCTDDTGGSEKFDGYIAGLNIG